MDDVDKVQAAGMKAKDPADGGGASVPTGLTGKRKIFGCLCVFLWFVVVWIAISFVVKDPPKEQWLKQNAQRLSSMKITPDMIAKAAQWREEGGRYCYFVPPNEDIVPLGDGGGVYIVMHSWHDRGLSIIPLVLPALLLSRSRPVADAVLAMDQQGRFYTFETHVCGGLNLMSDKKVITIEDFLQTYRYGEREKVWRPYP